MKYWNYYFSFNNVVFIQIQPIHLKYWNKNSSKFSTTSSCYSTDTFEVLKLTRELLRQKKRVKIQPIHLKYWNRYLQAGFSIVDNIQPIHLKYWNSGRLIDSEKNEYIQPIHLKYWNRDFARAVTNPAVFNRYIWSIETKRKRSDSTKTK